jgi:hypothetical protein
MIGVWLGSHEERVGVRQVRGGLDLAEEAR